MNVEKSPPVLPLQCLGFLAASVLLGVGYNRLSPLGLREGKEPAVTSTVTAQTRATSGESNPYENVGIRLEVRPLGSPNPRPKIEVELPRTGSSLSAKGHEIIPGIRSPMDSNRFGTNAASPFGGGLAGVAAVHNFPVLSWAEAQTEVEAGKAVLVDARLPKYFEIGAIPKAVPLYAGANSEELAAFAAKYPAETPLIVYESMVE